MSNIVDITDLTQKADDREAAQAVEQAQQAEKPTIGQGFIRQFPIGIYDEMENFIKASYPVNGVPMNVAEALNDLRACKVTTLRALSNLGEAIDLNGAPRKG